MLLITTNPETSAQLEKFLSEYISSKPKITGYEKTSFQIMLTEIIKTYIQYHKIAQALPMFDIKFDLIYIYIQIAVKTKHRISFTEY